MSPGTLTVTGNYSQTAAGFLDVELQNLASFDLLLVNGTASLGGGLTLACFASCSYAVNDEFVILDSTGNLTGTFSSVALSGFATGQFDVIYDYDNDQVRLKVTQLVTAPIPEPETYAMLLMGLGVLGVVVRRRRASA